MDVMAWSGHGWGAGPWIGILWLAFWVFVVAGVFFVLRRRSGYWHVGRSAETVLSERYARGEISEEEYRQRLKVLREDGR
jgi:putative membrane protein